MNYEYEVAPCRPSFPRDPSPAKRMADHRLRQFPFPGKYAPLAERLAWSQKLHRLAIADQAAWDAYFARGRRERGNK